MTDKKWTPGPWRVSDDGGFGFAVHSVDPTWDTVCECNYYDGNAHLIAAAPDLYDALEKCVEELESQLHDGFDGVWHESDFEKELSLYRAALAKARGEALIAQEGVDQDAGG